MFKLLRICKVVLSALEMSLRCEKGMKGYYSELPPAWYNQHLKQFNNDVMQIYKDYYTECFNMLIVWSPKVR